MSNHKPTPGWESRYLVSDAGHVYSLGMWVGAKGASKAFRQGRKLKPVIKGGRYLVVTLARGAARRQCFIHDLVAAAFIGPKPPGMEVLHANDDKYDNRVVNLRYGTKAENEIDRQKNGKVARGERHGCAKLTEAQVRHIRDTTGGASQLAAIYGVSLTHVWAIRTGRVWKHLE